MNVDFIKKHLGELVERLEKQYSKKFGIGDWGADKRLG